jgi:tripartite-type tricarboxylate transporter receptor subunit TctC
MKFISRRRSLAALASIFSLHASAETSGRPIRLIVPFSAGGGVDQMARALAPELGRLLSLPVVVENVTGAGGTIASATVARAQPDGHTLIFHSVSTAAVNAVTLSKLAYDPVRGFMPISLVGRMPLILTIHPSVPARTLKEFVALTRANPNAYSYGSSGAGTSIHLASELLKQRTGAMLQHVPYRGTAAATADLLAGHIQMLIDGPATQLGNISTGKVRALSLTTMSRLAMLPQIPTSTESGLADFDLWFWTAIFAPAGTPPDIAKRLSEAIAQAAKTDTVMRRFSDIGTEAVGSTARELQAYWVKEMDMYRKLIRDSNLKLDAE